MSKISIFRSLSLAFGIATVVPAYAANGTWTQTADGTYAWNTPTDPPWASGVVPGTVVGDVATFGSVSGAQTINLDDGAVPFNPILGQLVFNSAGSTTIAAGLGGAITFDNGGTGASLNATSGVTVVSAPITVADVGGLSVVNTSGALGTSLTLGAINNGGFTLTFGGTGTTAVNGIISGTAPLNKIGAGLLALGGANTFTGAIGITGGTLSVAADGNLGAAANAITIDGGTLQSTGATVSMARAITLGAGGGTIEVTGTNSLAVTTALVANANALTKIGTGSLTFSAASTRSGTTAINAGRITASDLSAHGTGAVTVTNAGSEYALNPAAAGNLAQNIVLNSATTFTWTPNLQLTTNTSTITVNGTGATIFVGGTLSTGKLFVTANTLSTASGSVLTKTGGGVMQLAGANAGFLGDMALTAGTIEFQNVDSLGAAVKTVTISGTGDLATGGVSNRNNIVLSGGILSANNAAAIYTGTVTANTATTSTIALRQFQTPTTANSFRINGNLLGDGNLNVTAPAAATLTLGTTPLTAGTPTNNTGFTGRISAGGNATVLINQPLGSAATYGLAGGTVALRTANLSGASLGSAGITGTYINIGANSGTGMNDFALAGMYVNPRAYSRTDLNVNMPNSGSGDWPIVPIPGFPVTAAGGQRTGVMWKGLINITTAGTYQFSGTNDDNLVLIIDGTQVGTLGVISANTNIGGGVVLSAGQHSIVVKHTQGGGGGYATLSYNGADTSNTTVLVPNSVLNTGSLAATSIGLIDLTANSTLDVSAPTTSTSINLGNASLTVTSATIDNLSIAGGVITAATPTLAPTTGGLIFTGAIGETGGSRGLNVNGPFFTEFQAANTYTGVTTVNGGQLRLNSTGSPAIAGNLTVNAGNTAGAVKNVLLMQSNQIATTATVTMTNGILDIGAFNNTIANLAVNGGFVIGTSGVLTVTNAPTLTAGYVGAILAGNYNLAKSGTGTAVLAGANTYTGLTNVNAGVLMGVGPTPFGAGGAGNETVVANNAAAYLANAAMAVESVTISGTGIVEIVQNGSLRNLSGTSTINNLTTGAASTLQVDNGQLIVNGVLDVTAGALTKTGEGALVFSVNQATLPAVTLSAGALGFSGTQSFGAAAVPTGLAFQFNSDPGAAVDITVGSTSRVIGNYAFNQSLVSRLNAASDGTLVLTGDNANNLNFSGVNVGLGASGVQTVYYTGTITPNAGGYKLGGGGGRLNVQTALTGTNPVSVNGTVLLSGNNTFTGDLSVNAGGTLAFLNDNLGASANVVNLNGGSLQVIGTTSNIAGLTQFGNVLSVAAANRVINVGAGGGTINIPAISATVNLITFSGTNSLTGSGDLTKTGLGLAFLLGSNSYSGNLIIAANSNRFDIRSSGALPNVASVTINQSSELDIDNNSTAGQRQFPSVDTRNRLNDSATIQLNGGLLKFVSRNVAFTAGTPATSQENVGITTLGLGQSFINATRTGGGGGDLVISNLVRTVGSGVVVFTTDGNTLGQFGDNPRIILSQVNGVAPTFSAFIGGWATINRGDFAAYGQNSTVGGVTATSTGVVNYGSTGAPTYTALTTTTAPGGGGFTTGSIGSAAANVVLGTAGPGQNFVVGALRLASGATQTLTFAGTTGTPDTLYVESGGVLSSDVNVARTIGVTTNAFTRGRLTAGTLTANTPQELFLHQQQSSMTVNAQIIDNPNDVAATVRVVKAQDATVILDGANLYSGGTLVNRGTLTVNSTGGLGTGAVTVKNSALNLGNKGSTSSTDGYTVVDNGIIVLTNGTNGAAGQYNSPGDRFNLASGSILYANSPGAGSGFNSLTRVSTLTAGGQIVLAPGAIIKHNMTNAANQGSGTLTIQNLGTNADLFFAPGGNGGIAQAVTLGAGTPWAGMSSDRGNLTWNTGTVILNSDITLQGLTRDGGVSSLSFGVNSGGDNNQGSFQFVNNSGGAVNARIVGTVVFSEDEPIVMPSDLTFVVTAGGLFQPNFTRSLGFGSSVAKLVVQAGGTVDPGNFVALGATANTNRNPDGSLNNTQNLPYALVSPVNGLTTFEAGSRFLINDASGIGSAPVGSWTMKTGAVLDLGNTNAFFGRGSYPLTLTGTPETTGVIQNGQFVYENGVIVKIQADNIYKLSQLMPSASQAPIVEIFGGNRFLTSQNNPFIIPVVGTPTIAPETITFGSGSILTNDSSDRAVNEGRGKIVLQNGSILAATAQTFFNISEGVEVPAGATVTVGTSNWINGNPKNGLVQFTGPQSNTFGAGAKLVVLDGSAFGFNAANVFPDTTPIELPAAVTNVAPAGAVGFNPGNGSTLLPNVGNFAEIVGQVTGNGSVIANAGGTYLGINSATNFTSNIRFRSANGQQANLWKIGAGVMSYTGSSDSTGIVAVGAGELRYINGGNSSFGENRLQKGGLLTLDNTGTALNNRLGGTARSLTPMGGTIDLIGNASTPVQESLSTLFNSASNFGPFIGVPGVTTLKVTPGTAATTFFANTTERFNDQGIAQQRSGTWIINSPTVGNAPITFLAAGGIAGGVVPGTGATENGLVQIANPGLTTGAGAYAVQSGGIYGTAGTASAPSRPDYLGDSDGNGIPEGFMTQDGVLFTTTNTVSTAIITGLPSTTGLLPGMLVNPTTGALPAGTRILSVDSATQITLTNNSTTAVAALQVITGGMRNLTNAEYSPFIRYNQTNGLNVKLSGTTTVGGDSRPSTLTMTPASVLNISGTLPFNTVSSRFLLSSGGIFVQAGAASTINGGTPGTSRNFLQTPGGVSLYLHVYGDLNLNAAVFTDSNVVKTGSGTLNVGANAFNFFRGSLQIDAGTVNLGANNYFANVRVQNGFNSSNNLYLNGGTLNLGGNSVVVNVLANNNELPGMGGTVTSATPATLTVVNTGRFSGTIAGSISLYKPANNTLLLTNDNTYTGTTTVAAGTLSLRDSGQLSGTSAVNINYATLQFDNSYLSNVANRIPAATPVTLRGATVNITGAAGQVASQTFNTLTLAEGRNDFTSNAGGSGANEITIVNLVRSTTGSGAVLNINQNYGFLGAAGNTTAIRNFITNINGTPAALVNGILPAWIIVGNDHFATYSPTTGIGALTNTADGYRGYDSGDATTATATQNVNDGAARTFAASKTINAWRIAGGAVTMTLNANVGLTIASGGLLTNTNNAITFAGPAATLGQSITSGTGELTVFINQNTTNINIPITGNIDLVKSGGATLSLNPNATGAGPNTYTGTTYVNNGTLQLNGAGSTVAVPGNLVITAATVTEANAAGQIATTSNVTIGGGGRLNLVNLAGVNETLNSLTFLDGASGTATANGLDRTAAQPTSIITLTAATPITSTNSNPSTGVPFIGANTGILAFSNVGGATLNVNSALYGAGNSPAVGLRIAARIGSVPTLAEGGLIKSGNGLLVLEPGTPNFSTTPASYDGTIGSLTDVLNISTGFVRMDTAGALGINSANTTVQSGAVLLGANAANQVITGSITLKNGSTLGAMINAFTLGTATTTVTNQSVLNLPSGTVHIAAYDYFIPATNAANITINGRLSGAGTIDIYGPQMSQGNGGGGTITLGNPILTGLGSNDFTGTINVGTNAILQNLVALTTGITRTTGNALGSAVINLNGGRLRVRDDASPTADVSNTTVSYSTTNVTLSADSFLDANRQTSTTASGNIINFGTLNVTSGTKVLTVDSGNAYQVGFATMDGSGTLIKAGGSILNINGIAGTFTGGLGIAGPVGYTVVPTTTPNLVMPATATLPNFVNNGLYVTEAGKTLNVTSTFTVNDNPGDVNLGLANNHARLGISNTTTLNVGTFVNNGGVGSLGGTATITATTGFTGNGYYLTTTATGGAVTGRDLTLAGNIIGGTFRVAGVNTVTVTGTTLTPVAIQVQSGTLALSPTANATSSGPITVFGSPATTATTTTAPVVAVNGTLRFAAPTGTGTLVHTGNIANNGLVLANSGTITVNGNITGSTVTNFTPGLLEGLVMGTLAFTVDGTRPANTGNFGVQNQPRMLQNNSVTQQALTGHLDNEVWVYSGYVRDNDGVFSFAGNQDDNLAVWVNGALVLNQGGNVVGSTALKHTTGGTGTINANGNGGTPSQNFGPGITLPGFGSGWYLLEIRMRNGAGGAGPWGANGFGANFGFGYKDGIGGLDSADYIKPVDDGTGNLFVTPLGNKGSISVASVDSNPVSLIGQSFDAINTVTLDPTNGAALVRVTNAAATNNADFLSVVATASSANATLDVAGGATVNFGTSAPAFGGATIGTVASTTTTMNFVRNGAGTSTVRINNAYTQNVNVVVDTGVRLLVNAAGTGDATKTITVNSGATLGGTGSVVAPVTTSSGSILSPGDGTTTAVFGTGVLTYAPGTIVNLKLTAPGASPTGNDWVNVADFSNVTPGSLINGTLNLTVSGTYTPGNTYHVFQYQTADPDVADFNTWSVTMNGTPLTASTDYTFAVDTTGKFVNIIPTAVPEPGTILLLGAIGLGVVRMVRRRQSKAG